MKKIYGAPFFPFTMYRGLFIFKLCDADAPSCLSAVTILTPILYKFYSLI